MAQQTVDIKRRRFLNRVLGGFTVLGGIFAMVPFVRALFPNELTKALGAPLEVSLSDLAPGQLKVVGWRGKPVWIIRRTGDVLDNLAQNAAVLADPNSKISTQPVYISDTSRAIRPEYLILVGICPHLGCSPLYKPLPQDPDFGDDWNGGFFCPCHGSKFDMAGRVYKNMPAPSNLEVPPHRYADDTTVIIGEDPIS